MTQEDERIARKLLDLSSRSDRVQIRNGMTYLDGYALGNGTVELRSQVVRDRRMRMRIEEEILTPYTFAFLYYVNSPTAKDVWLRDDTNAPVQIATWPKRLMTGFPVGTARSEGQEAALGPTTIGYLACSQNPFNALDDLRTVYNSSTPTRNTIDGLVSGGLSPFIRVAMSNELLTAANSVSRITFADNSPVVVRDPSATPQSGYGSGVLSSISNYFKVYGFTKTRNQTQFALATEPIIRSTPIPDWNGERIFKMQHGTADDNVVVTFPTMPEFDPELQTQTGFLSGPYQYGTATTSWTENRPLQGTPDAPGVFTSCSVLVNNSTQLTIRVQDTRDGVTTLTEINTDPLPSHERIIGIVAYPTDL